ncbi:MAG: EVE domain-containing protein [Phycisphaeraceae bacterium]|nr:MAG: EVE domain-containing protein [Phycisphaeraceae bacterium]
MTTYLLKTEPGDYAYDDLVRDGRTAWTGVANPAAQQAMRAMQTGDEAFIYHTGDERRIAGLAKVVRGAYPDPDHPGLTAKGDPKRVLVDVAPVKAATKAVTLADIKADERFADFALVRQSRLGAMEVPAKLAGVLRKMAGL